MPPPARLLAALSGPAVALYLTLCLGACAIIKSPTGGVRDVAGPVLDTALSTPNFQLDYRPEQIVLEFDEYVVLKDASRNVVLTPTPESGKPTFAQRLRRVTVDFAGVTLRDSTTYQIQFGNTIQDFNEGNPAEALRYVFSTGGYFDSLALGGQVVAATDGAPLIGALVGLYRNPSDTALTRTAPDYFARTDSSGRFRLDYLAPGRYQLAAYVDDNGNYRLNEGVEDVAVADSLVSVAAGRLEGDFTLRSSVEFAPLRVLRAEQIYPGYIRLTLNRPATDEITVEGLAGEVVARVTEADSLYLAFRPAVDSVGPLLVRIGDEEVDTARFRKTLFATAPVLRKRTSPPFVDGEAVARFALSAPLETVNLDSIRVLVDSVATAAKGEFAIDTLDRRVLRWRYPLDTVREYEVVFLPGALRGFGGEGVADSLTERVRPQRAADFGELTLTLDSLRADRAYVVEIVGEQDKVVRSYALPRRAGLATDGGLPDSASSAVATRYTDTRVLRRLAPGTYTLRLIDDADGNGRYSVGNRRQGRRPERIRRYPIEQVRADWTVEQRVGVE